MTRNFILIIVANMSLLPITLYTRNCEIITLKCIAAISNLSIFVKLNNRFSEFPTLLPTTTSMCYKLKFTNFINLQIDEKVWSVYLPNHSVSKAHFSNPDYCVFVFTYNL